MASAVGHPKKLHPNTEACTSFDSARIFVEADLSKELPKKLNYTSKTGFKAEVLVSYPWLPPRCSTCNKWGHLNSVCQKNLTESQDKSRETIANKETSLTVISEGTSPVNLVKASEVHVDLDLGSRNLKENIQKETVEEGEIIQDQMEVSETTCTGTKISQTQLVMDEVVVHEQRSEEVWTEVSPLKSIRNGDNHHKKGQQLSEKISISPSRFSVLESEEEKSCEDSVIMSTKEQTVAKSTKAQEQLLRPVLPRAKKGINRYNEESTASKGRDSVSTQKGKHSSQRKH